MTNDNFDKCVDLVLSLNPKDVQFNEEEFNLALRTYLAGDREALTQLNFVYACDWLLKDYIEENRTSFRDFEDEVMDAYIFASSIQTDPIMRFRPYRTFLKHQTENYFQKLREERLEKNLQLNLVPNCKIEDVEDEKAEQEIYDYVTGKEVKRYLERFVKKCSMSQKKKEMAEDYLNFSGEKGTRRETAKKFGATKEQVLCASAKYLRELRKEVASNPNKFPLETPYDK